MATSVRIEITVDNKRLLKELAKFEGKLKKSKRLARGKDIVNFAIKEGSNPVNDSITQEIQKRNLSNQNTIERLTRKIVESKLSRGNSKDIIWDMRLLDIFSPLDKRLIVKRKKIGISIDLKSLQKIVSDTVSKDFNLFISADLATQARKGEIPNPPAIKAIIVDTVLGKDLRKPIETTKFISNIQFTVLVRKEMAKRMPKGTKKPRLPPPNPSKGLTFRTGKFVNSTDLIINYKKKIISYFIEPPYDIFLNGSPAYTRYQPEGKTIIPSIRTVARTIAADKFNIIRG